MVRAFLLLDGSCADEAERPPLELLFVFLGERGGFVGRGRLADDADEGDVFFFREGWRVAVPIFLLVRDGDTGGS